jgi:hypothetical protein
MGLDDLRAFARAYRASSTGLGTPGTHGPSGPSSETGTEKNRDSGGFRPAGTPGTPGTRDFPEAHGPSPKAPQILDEVLPEQTVEEVADRAAVAEIDRNAPSAGERPGDQKAHAALLSGLHEAALQRPPSWWRAQPHRPAPGTWCSCCRGRRWWTRDGGQGWCCQICHPAPGQRVVIDESDT